MAAGLQTHIWNNNFKSIALLAFYPFLIAAIIWGALVAYQIFGWQMGALNSANALAINDFRKESALAIIIEYFPLILAGVSAWFFIAYFFHTKMIRHMAHSHPVTREDEPELYNLLENLSISQGIKMPRLEIVESHARNAFASGVDTKSFSVTVTRGLIQSLSKDEVEAVLAHELTHILNRDVRLLIITIIFTGMVGFAAQVLWSQVRYSLWVPRHRSRDGKGSGGFIVLLAVVAVLWVGYMATLLTRFAISRNREYMADAGAVQMTKKPEAMMRALMRIAGADRIPKIPGDITMMCIENSVPFMGMFATHPPISKRIMALSETTNTPIPEIFAHQGATEDKLSAPRASEEDRFTKPLPKRENWTTRQRFSNRRKGNPWTK